MTDTPADETNRLVISIDKIDADHITISEGHQYSQIDDHCPACASPLELFDIQADTENGAHASAHCASDDCEWIGTAVYRLIDLAGGCNPDDRHESAVSTGQTPPEYYSY